MLPLSVLIPTRDCAGLVPGHTVSMQPWLDLAEEVILVDSNSRDETVPLLRAGLNHPQIRYLTHPPGLYESWNYGVAQARAKYVYISTVGDSITRAGIEHLVDVSEQFGSDVVISKPTFIDGEGRSLPEDDWTIDVVFRRLHLRQPTLLSKAQQFLFAVTNLWGALLGSSASDLYRTKCLQDRPFPTGYAGAGDGGWGLLHAFAVKIAVTPARFSTFRYHDKPHAMTGPANESLALKQFRLAQKMVAQERLRDPAVEQILAELHWGQLEGALEKTQLAQDKLEQVRRQPGPSLLRPAAWSARARRRQGRDEIEQILSQILPA